MALPNALKALILAGIFLSSISYIATQDCGCDEDLCCSQYGYCGTGDEYCGTGCQEGPCGNSSPTTPTPTPNNVSVASIVSDSFFDAIIDHADGSCAGKHFYSRSAFLDALNSYPQFGSSGSDEENKREIAAFFAHATFATRHFCHVEEIDGPTRDYCDKGNTQYVCVTGKGYYGRGPMQLTWNFNYGPAGASIGFDGLNSPETVAKDPVVSFKTAIWFWTNNVKPVMGQGFGATTRAIDGGLECDGTNPSSVQARVKYYMDYCSQIGVAPGDNLSC